MLETFRALAEPSRFQIVELLSSGPLPVGEVVDRLKIRQPQASKHLRALSEAGLVEVRPEAQRRIYALRTEPFRQLDLWLERYRLLGEEQFTRLDELLEELQTVPKGRQGQTKAQQRRSPRRTT